MLCLCFEGGFVLFFCSNNWTLCFLSSPLSSTDYSCVSVFPCVFVVFSMWWDFVGHFPLFTTDRGLLRLLSSSFPSASWCFCFVFELVLSSLISFQGVNDYGYFSHILVLLGVLYVSVSVVFYFGSVLQICLALFRTRWNFSLSFYLPNRKLSSTFIFSLFILLRHMNLIYTYTLDLSCPEWSTPLHLGWDEIARGPPDPIIGLSIRILTNCSRIHPGFHFVLNL